MTKEFASLQVTQLLGTNTFGKFKGAPTSYLQCNQLHLRRVVGDFDRQSSTFRINTFFSLVMILSQVHLREPCYDFYFIQAIHRDSLPAASTARKLKKLQSDHLDKSLRL